VPREEAEELANSYHMPFLETSAKKSLNVDDAFMTMTKEIKDKLTTKQGASATKQN
jgi:Ras-related protein Rab-1A